MRVEVRHLTAAIALVLLPGPAATAPQSRTVVLSSPSYTLDIGLDMTGQCGPFEGSSFKRLDLYSGFANFRFVASPVVGQPLWFEARPGTPDAGFASHQLHGKGEIRGFDLCPAWEDLTHPIAAKVTSGPSPFKPRLRTITADEARDRLDNPDDPMTPKDLVPVVWFEYSTAFSILGKELAWEHPTLSTNSIPDFVFVFSVPVEALGKGRQVSFTLPHSGEKETGTWSVMITPAKLK